MASHTPMTGQLAPPAPSAARGRLRRWLHEPLLHFLLVGASMFGAYAWLNRDAPAEATNRQIVLTDDDLLQMQLVWRSQGRPEPTAQQMQAMIEAKVREEVLYREALAMGLENDDVIVRRRLAQKMDFLAEDLAGLREPSSDELRTWYKAHPNDFAHAPRASFHHLYFSFDKRQQRAHDDAAAALKRVAAQPANLATIGDTFMFQDRYADRTPQQAAGVFGGPFAKALFELEPGAWSAPIESAFGWHLVFVDEMTPGRLPDFDEVEPEVKAAWIREQRAALKREAYEVMRAKYRIVLPTDKASAALSGAPGHS